MEHCNKENCTGCGACAFVCAKQCIKMLPDSLGTIYPVIDKDKCIECGVCQKACPSLNPVERRENIMAYAAWSNSPVERRTSASGGVAAEMYRFYLDNGMTVGGASVNKNLETVFSLTGEYSEAAGYKNSKYVFSTMYTMYPELKKLLSQKQKVMVIGLPCQIAALRKLFKDDENLFLADVVCHGTTNQEYLNQHIHAIEKKYNEKAAHVDFRDPKKDTVKYFFSLYNDEGVCFYSQRTKDGDLYQYGYHRSVSYRENCFHCLYAEDKRISDITLADYSGLGKIVECGYSADNVSLVLVHTKKGKALLDSLISEQRIVAEERPKEEGINGNSQLQHPSVKSFARRQFEKKIIRTHGNFEKTMEYVICTVKCREFLLKQYGRVKKIGHKILR